MARVYSSTSVDQTLQSGINASATSIPLANSAAVLALFGGVSVTVSNTFTIAIDPDTASEEIIVITGASGANLTGIRGQAGTAATTHDSGAIIRHVLTSLELTNYESGISDLAAHTVATTSTHGVTGSIVGTANSQTLTNKTIAFANNTLTGVASLTTSQTIANKALSSTREITTISATAATGTIDFDYNTQSVLYYTTNASANWTLNVRASSSATLASVLATNDAATITFLVTNGTTAYYPTALTIDGTAVTPKWQGGQTPSVGSASAIDAYVYTIVKTAATPTYTVFASKTKFA
jgi:hypothetical protein